MNERINERSLYFNNNFDNRLPPVYAKIFPDILRDHEWFLRTAHDVEGTLLDLKQNVQITLPFMYLVSFT